MVTNIKKLLPIIVLVIFVYVWYVFSYSKSRPVTVAIEPVQNNLTLFVEPNAGHDPIVNTLNNAQKEILMEVYLLSDKDVINALENAKSRGVGVNVILEEHPFGGGGLNPGTKKELESKGIKVMWSNKSYSLTHEKSIVIDGTAAWVLTQNLTTSSFTKNREYDILDTNKSDVDEIRNIFLNDWQRQSYTPTDKNLVVSPNTSRGSIITLITNAKNEIDIEIEDINDEEITALLAEKAKTVKVNLIIPSLKQLSANAKDAKKLIKAGATVKSVTSPYMHAKLILVDKVTAYIGSVNLSSQSMDENRELGIIFSQSDAINTLNTTFQTDWNSGIILP